MRLLQINRYYADVGGTERYFSEMLPRIEAQGIKRGILYGFLKEGVFHLNGQGSIWWALFS